MTWLISNWPKVVLALLLAGSHYLAYDYGTKIGDIAVAKAGREKAAAEAAASKAWADAVEAIRKAEQDNAYQLAQVGQQYERDKNDAVAKERAVTAAVRAGAERLRKHWTCPEAQPGAAPGEPDAAADLRAADSGRLVRIGSEADAQIRGLQAVIEQYQEAFR